jgi:hypothetical protein
MTECGYRGYRARRPLVRRGPARGDIVRAIPGGSRRLVSRSVERQYLTALGTWPELLELRADARANVLEVAKWLARFADHHDGTTRPVRARLCERASVSESTWKAARRLLERWGFLGTVSAGCKRYRPGQDRDEPAEVRHDAAVYVICVPRAQPPATACTLTRPPTGSRRDSVLTPARATPGMGTGNDGAPPERRTHHRRRLRRPEAGSAAGAMAETMRRGAGHRLTDGWARHLAAPFLAAGWTADDLAYAIEHTGDGRQHRAPVRDIKNPAGWLRWRLGHWLDHGQAALSITQLRRKATARQQAAAAAWRAERAAAAAAWVDPAPRATAIREAMGWPA